MKISIVTISFNQVQYVEQAILSVLDQAYPGLEYIVVDAGSTDGSRAVIENYLSAIDRVVFEPDQGPADGLNKGFSVASGEVLGFLNADDYLLPGALERVAGAFSGAPAADVLSGHALVVDAEGRETNRFYSRRFNLRRFAYGASTIAQQSTFFRADAFHRAGGFNVGNRIAWDGELWVDLAQSGARFSRINAFLSAHRIYADSITGSGKHPAAYEAYLERMFERITGRPRRRIDEVYRRGNKLMEYLIHPRVAATRLVRGPVVPDRPA